MTMKQPRIPEWRKGEETGAYVRKIALFLKDFCQEIWRACSQRETLERMYPIGSIYLSAGEKNPEDCFGGKWEKLEAAIGGAVSAWQRIS